MFSWLLFQIVNNESEKIRVHKHICQNHTYVFKPQTCITDLCTQQFLKFDLLVFGSNQVVQNKSKQEFHYGPGIWQID